ncbi:MAG: hypothetical protein IJJ01_07445 [Firmicutes bacterium]|nr:hypothetical protein [Bacillota bacterium]
MAPAGFVAYCRLHPFARLVCPEGDPFTIFLGLYNHLAVLLLLALDG